MAKINVKYVDNHLRLKIIKDLAFFNLTFDGVKPTTKNFIRYLEDADKSVKKEFGK